MALAGSRSTVRTKEGEIVARADLLCLLEYAVARDTLSVLITTPRPAPMRQVRGEGSNVIRGDHEALAWLLSNLIQEALKLLEILIIPMA